MSIQDPIVIVGAARTPMGSLQGDFSSLAAHDLGGAAIKAAIERAGVSPDAVGEVLFGNCLMAGQGQAPARQAAIGAGVPTDAACTTVSKVCGSGMQAVMFAHDAIVAGSRNWRLERMARVDRNILRLAVGELIHAPETPVRVVINEAVELAKRFSTDDSGRFVTGVLASLVPVLRGAEPRVGH